MSTHPSFIGREREIKEIQELLSASRLVTLTGEGGCGKSRLSLEVAEAQLGVYSDGVWWVELAPLADSDIVPHTVAYALGLRDLSGRPELQVLTDYLRSRNAMLILDNCEHLIRACASLSEVLLRACPRLSILVTSREILSVSGETIYIVPPLDVPASRWPLPLAELAMVESVRLFVERVADFRLEFALTDRNSETVAQICRRLDGIPLAIELAAARVNIFPLTQIAERLDDRFQLLTSGSRTALPRHQTLRSMMDWSYALLSQPEQQLLNQLSVFAGDFDLKATEGICGAEYNVASDVFETLAQLVNKSLVVVDRTRGDDVRYLLHETIRQYAREKLEVTGETEKLKNYHAQFYGRMALDLHQGAKAPLTVNAIFDHEMGNFRAALHWLYVQENFEDLAQLCAILGDHWFVRGYINEGQEWLDRVLDQRPTLSLPIQGMVLKAKGKLLYERGEYGPAL